MPPKNKKQKEIVQDERLQAVVMTDSFETRFMPLTAIKPRCLLPLANVPLIEYTLEFLAKAGVDEVFIVCCSHSGQIQEYINNSKWSTPISPFKISTIVSGESRSLGDAMRDIDNRGLISGDFLLVSGDVVTNVPFEKALHAHKQRKAADKNHIATMVLTKASPLHRSRSHIDPGTFILDTSNNRCLYYQDIPAADGPKTSVSIDPELLNGVEEFSIRNDLIDCSVDICTPQVPIIFTENFDYQYLRKDFLKGVLTSDLLGKTISAYISEDYSARVESWQTYHGISQDLLARWCAPIVPESNLLDGQTYSYESKHIYKEENVVLAQSCKIGSCTMIGTGTVVGDASSIANSIIGRNCTIGKNVQINNCYIWDDSVIEDNVKMEFSIIASNTRICKNAVLNSGSVTGFNAVVGCNVEIPKNTRIIEKQIATDDGFDDSEEEEDSNEDTLIADGSRDPRVVGEDGVGFLYDSDFDDEDSEEDVSSKHYSGIIYQLNSLNISDDSIVSLTTKKKRRTFSTTSIATDMQSEAEEEDFMVEGVATVERSIEQNHDLDTAVLELNTLRMSMDVSYHEVRKATSQALINRVSHFFDTKTLDAKGSVNKVFGKWSIMYKRQLFDPEDQVDLLNILQDLLTHVETEVQKALLWVLPILYNEDILEEDNILEWWNSERASSTEKLRKVREGAAQFALWLEEAEEESD